MYSFAAVSSTGSTERARFHEASFKLYKSDDNEEAAMCFMSDLAKLGRSMFLNSHLTWNGAFIYTAGGVKCL